MGVYLEIVSSFMGKGIFCVWLRVGGGLVKMAAVCFFIRNVNYVRKMRSGWGCLFVRCVYYFCVSRAV